MMARVSVPFTEGHYYGREERPNTELADNSLFTCRESIFRKIVHMNIKKIAVDYNESSNNNKNDDGLKINL